MTEGEPERTRVYPPEAIDPKPAGDPVCAHLMPVVAAAAAAGFPPSAPMRPWSQNCRWWVWVDCLLDQASLRRRLDLADVVGHHAHLGTVDGAEAGFWCREHDDGVIGFHPEVARRMDRQPPVLR